MRIGEVSLNTNDVVALANFYKRLLGIDNGSNDEIHQVLIGEETQLSIYNDGSHKNNESEYQFSLYRERHCGRISEAA